MLDSDWASSWVNLVDAVHPNLWDSAVDLTIATAAATVFWFRLKRSPVDELAEPGHHTEEAHDAVDVQNVIVGAGRGFDIVDVQWLEQRNRWANHAAKSYSKNKKWLVKFTSRVCLVWKSLKGL